MYTRQNIQKKRKHKKAKQNTQKNGNTRLTHKTHKGCQGVGKRSIREKYGLAKARNKIGGKYESVNSSILVNIDGMIEAYLEIMEGFHAIKMVELSRKQDNIIVLVFDLLNIKSWEMVLKLNDYFENTPRILCANKNDRFCMQKQKPKQKNNKNKYKINTQNTNDIENNTMVEFPQKSVNNQDITDFCFKNNVPFIQTSAVNNFNIDLLFQLCVNEYWLATKFNQNNTQLK